MFERKEVVSAPFVYVAEEIGQGTGTDGRGVALTNRSRYMRTLFPQTAGTELEKTFVSGYIILFQMFFIIE